ncbi:MAG: tRNA-dihydrouridine synthase family protein [Myxococcales bacterium]|nr:MAG: tRNA-dihydrouridine synthase family protein [Myxococcales bacterium]
MTQAALAATRPAATMLARTGVRRSPLPFTAPWLLAPMEGVTEPCFRDLVLARNPSTQLGGAFTEFVRVSATPAPHYVLQRHLGPQRFEAPVGLQLMGSDLGKLAATARNAVECGAPLIDLNFGCPAKGSLRGCAGSALLAEPAALERVVRAVVDALPGTPVSAKMRAGIDCASRVEELARAAEAGGASLLTVHCRTRAEGFQARIDWTRIARAVAAVSIPVCGNGGVATHADLQRMRDETGCAFVMVGRGALADPWIFSGARASRVEASRFLLDYAAAMRARAQFPAGGVVARLKQLFHHWTAGQLFPAEERHAWLRERDGAVLLGRLENFARA